MINKIGIILAGGKGTRIKAKTHNKVVTPFLGKPMIIYGVELFEKTMDKTIVVVGAFIQSVKDALKEKEVEYIHQKKQLGTGHAVLVCLPLLEKLNPQLVFLGYGDHMMFYKTRTIKKLENLHKKSKAVMSFVTTTYPNPEELKWGIIVRDKNNQIINSVEWKDADEKTKKIKELNAGLYCFNFNFLKENIKKIKPSKITGEYYINSLVDIALQNNEKIEVLQVPFEEVGIGVNTPEELKKAEQMYLRFSNK